MSVALRTNGNGNTSNRAITRDPFALARDLFGWDPFFGNGRAPSAFVPSFEVKETTDSFVVKADLPGVAEMQKIVPREDLENTAKSFFDAFTALW